MNGATPLRDRTLDEEDHPLWALHVIADRKLAPLAPILTAIGAEAPTVVRPEQALKAVLLMAFFDLGDRRRACLRLAEVPAFQRFLGAHGGAAPAEEADLSRSLDRLLPRAAARDFVRDVMAAAHAAGISDDPRFTVNASFVGQWTAAQPPI